ncbi:MAG: tetratricopeptide repeat protein [Desulfotignum balticum]|jgi:tetratricopeptide (TPR) repeat protein|uniref:Tetratricopeptide repeat protein n=1 Tax=Desulfotignum balticum TaxID=115781 RepID=A0A931CS45_9BACT|nr:tetratricopeptide repeat protein [Desulfotignum balticum]
MTRHILQTNGKKQPCRQLWLMLVMILVLVVTGPPRILAAKENMPLAAGMAVNKAQSLMAEEKPDQALAVLTRYSEKQAGNVHYYIDFLTGFCHTELGQTGPAAEAFQRTVEKKPGLTEAWLNLARCRYEQGQMAEAAGAFEKGYDTSEENQPVHLFYASACHFQAGRPDYALTVFERLMAAHSEEITLEWKQTLVNILFALEKFRKALPWLEELAAETQGDTRRQWQEMLLYQYLSLEMKKKALAYARYLTRTHPEDPGWWKALAHVHLTDNRFEKALAAMLSYSYLTPLTREEMRLVADLYLSCNIPLSAARQYEAWLEQHGDTLSQKQVLESIKTISRAWLSAGNQDQALAWAKKGLAKTSDKELLHIKAYVLAHQEHLPVKQ